jgi:hypothetical protein
VNPPQGGKMVVYNKLDSHVLRKRMETLSKLQKPLNTKHSTKLQFAHGQHENKLNATGNEFIEPTYIKINKKTYQSFCTTYLCPFAHVFGLPGLPLNFKV